MASVEFQQLFRIADVLGIERDSADRIFSVKFDDFLFDRKRTGRRYILTSALEYDGSKASGRTMNIWPTFSRRVMEARTFSTARESRRDSGINFRLPGPQLLQNSIRAAETRTAGKTVE